MRKSFLFSVLLFSLFFSTQNLAGNGTFTSNSLAWLDAGFENLNAPPPSCNTPSGLYTSNITETSATFNWSSVSGAIDYSVQWREPNETWANVPGSPFDNTWITIYGLEPNTTYEWRVRANCYGGEYSAWSAGVTFTTDGNYYSCEHPDWLGTNNITQTSAIWDWSPVYGAENYSIQWRYPGGNWYTLGGGPWSETWVQVTNLDPCTTYEWRVKAYCSYNNWSPWSYPDSFTTLCTSCETPTETYTSNITETSATFNWWDVWGATSYSVQIRLPNGYWSDLPGNPWNSNWATAYNLTPATTYQWRVRANCGYATYSDWSYPESFTTSGTSYCHHPDWQETYNITEHSATWKWEHVYGATSYSVEWRYPGGTWYTLSGSPFTGTWVNVAHLQACTTYEWRVRSNCHYVWSPWSYAQSFTTTCQPSCSTPYGLYAYDITETSATLKWSPVYGAESYSVQIRDHYGTWWEVPGSPTTGTWITVHNLTPGKTYEWRVRSNCHYGSYSYWSKPKAFTTLSTPSCRAPEWVYTGGITNSSAIFNWAAVYGAYAYTVEWRAPGGSWNVLYGSPFSTNTAEITGLSANTTYEWRVKSHCHNGYYSYWSSTTHFTTLGFSCGLPFWRYTTHITETTARFNWSAVSGAANYTVQIRPINGTWEDVDGSPTTDIYIIATGLNPNTYYEWRMLVNCSNGGHSNWTSAILFFTGTAPGCGTPSGLYTDNITLTSATLNWAPVSGALNYSVEIRVLPHGAWNPVSGSPVDTNFIVVDGLSPFTTYEWRVRANCPNGYHSYWTHEVQFTTTDAPPCLAPTGLATSNITETTATLSWSPASGAQGYAVQTRLPGNMWTDIPGGQVTDTSVLVTGFTPNTTYEWRVRTDCGNGQYSNWSVIMHFTTTGTGPGNDECANALLLTVETSCVPTYASNVDASASIPPPVGGCWSNGYKDVWFKFTMPDVVNPTVTIRTSAGSLANGVMEIYTGSDCGIMSYITCEDNNDNGNGSSMPVVNLTGSPNATIWVRVWGYDGATGTFSICVFNYISVNFTANDKEGEVIDGTQMVKLEDAVSPSNETEPVSSMQMQVTPNPTRDNFNITYTSTTDCPVLAIAVHDFSGKTMLRKAYEQKAGMELSEQIDVSSFAPGTYIVQMVTGCGIITERVVVME